MIELSIPVPPKPILEDAFAYQGAARWISLWWEPAGDEAMISDGRLTRTGEWVTYLAFVRMFGPALLSYNLGSSDESAEHRLVFDLETRKVFIAPWWEAERFTQKQWGGQWSAEPVHLTEEQWSQLVKNIEREFRQVVPPSMEEIQAYRVQREEALKAFQSWMVNLSQSPSSAVDTGSCA